MVKPGFESRLRTVKSTLFSHGEFTAQKFQMLLLSSYNYPLARECSLEMLSVGDGTGASQVAIVLRTHLPVQEM